MTSTGDQVRDLWELEHRVLRFKEQVFENSKTVTEDSFVSAKTKIYFIVYLEVG